VTGHKADFIQTCLPGVHSVKRGLMTNTVAAWVSAEKRRYSSCNIFFRSGRASRSPEN
jgi:hypothetical protein